MSKKKYAVGKPTYQPPMKRFPESVKLSETIAVEEIITKDGCRRRKVYSRQMQYIPGSQPKGLPKK